ncbi:MAG: bifunctional adenosylcobinamide kinase/adenosylcobinamide-phosphate guanylyltransferase [Magnetococcales bacterium]|nr:bifunctional adenosylcobinamide kinase/adenosylcobinamide-phosphate guanylyltransferase [Magnetococcales bacterium]
MTAHLILGGARSGKSGHASRLAEESGLEVVLVATATRLEEDAELAERVARHRQVRPASWQVIEEPLRLGEALAAAHAMPGRLVIVDCLTVWLSNLLLADAEEALLRRERENLFRILSGLSGPLVLVGNETGLGVVPMGRLTRRFVDENGRLHQDLARVCDRVTFMVAGLPMTLKGDSPSCHPG